MKPDIAIPPADVVAQLPPPIIKLVNEIDSLTEKWRRAGKDVDERDWQLRTAADEDRQALADALRAGKPDPGRKATQRAKAAFDLASDRRNALDKAMSDAAEELRAALKQDTETTQKLDALLTTAHDKMRKSAERLAGELADRQALAGLRNWCQNPGAYRVNAGMATPLTGPNRDNLRASDLIGALVQTFTPTVPPPKPPTRPLQPRERVTPFAS